MPATILHPALSSGTSAARRTIVGARVLTAEGLVPGATVTIKDRLIDQVSGEVPSGSTEIDAHGLLLLPGIVDVHGDAFERALAPRPGVHLPALMALAENDAWLLSAGITTFSARSPTVSSPVYAAAHRRVNW